MIEKCNVCQWSYDSQDIYCSGCGKTINSYNIFPNFETIYSYAQYEHLIFDIENISSKNIEIKGIKSQYNVFNNLSTFLKVDPNSKGKYQLDLKNLEQGQNYNFSLNTNLNQTFDFNVLHFSPPDLEIYVNGVLTIDKESFYDEKENIVKCDSLCYVVKNSKDFNLEIKSTTPVIIYDFTVSGITYPLKNSYDRKTHYLNLTLSDLTVEFDFKIVNLQNISYKIKFKEVSLLALKLHNISPNPVLVNPSYNNEILDINIVNAENSEIEITEIIVNPEFLEFLREKDYEKTRQSFNSNDIIIRFDLIYSQFPKDKIIIGKDIYIPVTIKYLNKTINQENNIDFKISVLCQEIKELNSLLIIDLGTTNTCVSWINEDNEIKFLHFKENRTDKPINISQPSLLYALNHEKGTFESYESRAKSAYKESSHAKTVMGWKKFWGEDIKISLVDEKNNMSAQYSVEMLTQIYLKNIISWFENTEKFKAKKFAFTYPANYESKKYVILESMKNLGYDEKDILVDLNESNSVSYYFAQSTDSKYNFFREIETGQEINYAVFDMGGGTTDISICKLKNSSNKESIFSPDIYDLDILDSANPLMSGGDYLDFEIAKNIKETISTHTGNNIIFPEKIDEIFNKKFSQSLLNALSPQEHDLLRRNFSTLIGISRNEIKHIFNNLKNKDGKLNPFILAHYDTQNNTVKEESYNNWSIDYQNSQGNGDIIFVKKIEDECIKPFIEKQMIYLDSLIDNLVYLNKLETNKLDYIILCGNGSKLNLVYDLFDNKYKANNTQIILESENGKKATVEGACIKYNTNSDIELKSVNSLYVTLGYEQGGSFLPFLIDENGKIITTTRGISLLEENTYFSNKRKFNLNEKIYYSYKPIKTIYKNKIINNPDIKTAMNIKDIFINNPDFKQLENYIDQTYKLGIKFNKNFPEVDLIFSFENDTKIATINYKLNIK